MLENIGKSFEQAAVFQKFWTDSFASMTGAMSQFSPTSAPLEEARKMRSSMLKSLAETWEEFMRTPQFMETIKTSLNGMLDLRGLSREGMNKLHEQFEIPSKDDVDGILLAIRHIERRILDRIEGVDERIAALNERIDELEAGSKSRDRAPQKRSVETPKKPRTTVSDGKRATAASRQKMTTVKAKRQPATKKARR